MSTGLQSLFETAAGGALPQSDRLRQNTMLRQLAVGEAAFEQDTIDSRLYAVRSGLVKLAYLDEQGVEWIKSFSAQGGYFASIAALSNGGRTSFMAVAIEPSELEAVDYRLLETLADTHLAWARAVRVLTLQFAARKERRERELLTLNAEQRYRVFEQEQPALLARLSQKDLARHLGLTPVGLNRIAMRLRRAAGASDVPD